MNIKIAIILVSILVIFGVVVYRYRFHKLIIPTQNYQPFKNRWTDKNKNSIIYKNVIEHMLVKIVKDLQDLEIDIIPIYGSLLGMVRHGEIIPWDDDVDICVKKEHINTILEHKNKFKEQGLGMVEISHWVPFQKIYYIKIFDLTEPLIPGKNWSWPFIDIFSWEEKGEHIIISDASKPYHHQMNKADFLPFKCNMFGNIALSLPNNPDAFLKIVYGNDWETKCVSSSYNHRKEHIFNKTYTVKCSETISLQNDLFDNTWVINLESRPDRWEMSEKRLKSLGITPKRWLATDAKSQEFLEEYKRIPGSKRSKGEVACYKSHYALWLHLHKIGVESALIFEDDIIFPTGITKKDILEHMNESIGFDIIYLGHCYSNQRLFKNPKTRIGTAQCLHAYIVSKYGLKKLLEEDQKYNLPIDLITNNFCQNNICYISEHREHEMETFGYGIVHQDRKMLGSDIR